MKFNYIAPNTTSGMRFMNYNANLSLATPLLTLDNNGQLNMNVTTGYPAIRVIANTNVTYQTIGMDLINNENKLYQISIAGSTGWASSGTLGFYGPHGATTMVLSPIGNVGIGTTNPTAPLHVNTMTGSLTNISGRYFNFNANSLVSFSGTGLDFISILATGNIVASGGFYAYSDSRIKTNITDITDDDALHKLRLIQPKTYEYIDKVRKGTITVYGFIAQQIGDILPYAVSKLTDFIPNFYTRGIISKSGDTYLFKTTDKPLVFSPLTSETWDGVYKVKIYDKRDKEYIIYTRCEVQGDNYVITKFDGDVLFEDECFIYGQEVDDFHTLDKNAVFTISISAIQELDRTVISLQNTVSQLQEENQQLKTQINDILTRLSNANIA